MRHPSVFHLFPDASQKKTLGTTNRQRMTVMLTKPSLRSVVAPVLLILSAALFNVTSAAGQDARCIPTEPDMLGPFYKPGAPVRSSIGKGYLLSGKVKSSSDCSSVAEAKIELWLVGPDGEYHDGYRATVFSDAKGSYSFESHFPMAYAGRPPHIHIKVSAVGFKTLVTQHYPAKGHKKASFDLVLIPLP